MKRIFTPEVRTWNLVKNAFSLEQMHHSETIFTIGNGYLGTRGTFAEGYPDELASTLLHGVFNHHPEDLVPDLANAPRWFAVDLTVNGAPYRLDSDRVLGFRQELSLKTAILTREVLWQGPDGAVIRLAFERFASLTDQHVLAQRVTITALTDAQIACTAYLDGDAAWNLAYARTGFEPVFHWTGVQAETPAPDVALWQARTASSCYEVAFRQSVALSPSAIALERANPGEQTPGSRFAAALKPEQSISFTRLVAVATSRDTQSPGEFVAEKLAAARKAGYDALKALHEAAWTRVWDDADVVIEGDEFAQHAIRFALYHLLIAAPRHDERASIGAKTLSGPGYKGHIFWDTELFMLPPLVLTQPDVARNLLMYRYHNLPGARAKAREAGYEGALFPWESTDTGEETAPRWTFPDAQGHRIRIWTGDHEQHISADIAYAVWHYWRWTGDDAFMAEYGAELILDTAVFWSNRAEWHEDAGRYELRLQIGPDEFHENVDNPIYTNRLVVWHLERALDVLAWLKDTAPERATALIEQLDLTAARQDHWRDIIARMLIPRYEPLNVYRQFDDFFERNPVPVTRYEPRVINMDVIIGHEPTQASQVLKQADVVMLIALLGDALGDRDELMRNWDAYVPRTAHDSSLSPAIHAWVGARLGLVEEAYWFWLKSAGLDLDNNKGNVRDGIHAAATGALWQAIVFGFAGLHLEGDGWRLDPKLPPWWKSVSFSFYFRGEKQRVRVTPETP